MIFSALEHEKHFIIICVPLAASFLMVAFHLFDRKPINSLLLDIKTTFRKKLFEAHQPLMVIPIFCGKATAYFDNLQNTSSRSHNPMSFFYELAKICTLIVFCDRRQG